MTGSPDRILGAGSMNLCLGEVITALRPAGGTNESFAKIPSRQGGDFLARKTLWEKAL